MSHEDLTGRLSKITTIWNLLRQAHDGSADATAAAQRVLLERYGCSVRRYLLAILRDPHAADDLTQEFAIALLRGDFRQADPQRGRFRDYVKASLRHLVSKHRAKAQKLPHLLSDHSPEVEAPAEDGDRQFNLSWRETLLQRTWEALAQAHPGYHAILQARAAHPRLPSDQLAVIVARQTGKTLTAVNLRQTLHRARAAFVDLLIEEVGHSLNNPTPAQVEDELRELDLLGYCQHVLSRSQ